MSKQLNKKGFEIVENIFSENEVSEILKLIEVNKLGGKFGVREVLYNHSEICEKIFIKKFIELVNRIAPNCNKSIKSIYFDKPPSANWIVNWHQDLTINLESKLEVVNYKNWRVTKDRTVVQPNIELLNSIFTIRIHLDDCTKENGALRVIEESHHDGVVEIKDWTKNKNEKEVLCEVQKGGVLIMKPLILHSSKRTENEKSRRIIHIEFTDQDLPSGLKWKERVGFEKKYLV